MTIYRDLYLQNKWFADASPVNPKAASGTLTISGVVGDAQTVTIGENVYEFDINNTYTAGRIQVDVADLRNEATGTLTFIGVPIAAETVTLGSGETAEVYEFVAAAEDIADPANIPVVLGATLTADNAVTKLAEAINASSELVTAAFDTDDDIVGVSAVAKGTAGNAIDSTETCTNAAWGAAKLAGGLDTITATNAVTALVAAITANDEVVTAADGADDTVVVTAVAVGTGGNSVATTETMTNGAWGHAHLENGQYGTPCNIKDVIVYASPYYYWCITPGNQDDVAWQRFTPATY